MTVPQQKFREAVFQLLYSCETENRAEEDILDLLMKELKITRSTVKEVQERVHRILERQPEIDQIISSKRSFLHLKHEISKFCSIKLFLSRM